MLVLALVGFAIAFTLVVYSLLSQVEDRAETRDSLSQLESYETETVRDQELSQPLSERVIVPVLAGLTRLGKRLTPVGYIESVRQKLVYAGSDNPDAGDRFLALRVVTVALIPVWFIIAFTLLPLEGMLRFLAFLLVAIGLALGPDAVLSRRVDARQHQLQVKLPDILDLLVISVEAGLGFEQALDRTVHAVPGPLSEEFARMLGELRAGASRADALRSLEARTKVTEVRSFVLAILQADTFGVSIGRVLRSQAIEMRVKRRQLAQEKAQKAPVKMLIPMVFCIFPALFVVVLGPAGINIARNLG